MLELREVLPTNVRTIGDQRPQITFSKAGAVQFNKPGTAALGLKHKERISFFQSKSNDLAWYVCKNPEGSLRVSCSEKANGRASVTAKNFVAEIRELLSLKPGVKFQFRIILPPEQFQGMHVFKIVLKKEFKGAIKNLRPYQDYEFSD